MNLGLKQQMVDFFSSYSKNVDQADRQFFWKLSDRIVWEILKKYFPSAGSENRILLDAGGGTGRWIVKLADHFRGNFILYDFSTDMLKQARLQLQKKDLLHRVRLIQGDLARLDELPEQSVDDIISIYNPISFVPEKELVMQALVRVLRPGGRMAIMGQGYYNALYSKINNFLAKVDELEQLERTSIVQWTPEVPPLHVFSKESLEGLLSQSGVTPIVSFGVPVFAQPGPEDFDPKNKARSRLSNALENNEQFFQRVFEIEMKMNSIPLVVNRGMNILTIADKK